MSSSRAHELGSQYGQVGTQQFPQTVSSSVCKANSQFGKYKQYSQQ